MKLPLSSRTNTSSSSSACTKLIEVLSLLLLLLFTSCTTSVFDDQVVDSLPSPSLQQVTVNLTSFDITTTPATRADDSDSPTIPTNLNRLTCSVFNAQGVEVTTLSQKRESLNEDETFGNFTFTLPLGTYQLVAVVHEAANANDTPATINSPSLVTLPSKSIRDTYAKVQTFTVTRDGASITISMGTRINATFQLETTDNVPEGVTTLYVKASTTGAIDMPEEPTFNPTTGFATDKWKYNINLTATPGEKFNRGINLLLTSDAITSDITIDAYNGSTKLQGFTLPLTGVTLQRAYITHAKGTFFNINITGTSSFSFDETQGTHNHPF